MQTFVKQNIVWVSVNQGIQRLEPFKEKTTKLFKGEINYYSINLSKPENFTVFLTVHSGKVQLYMNEGFNIIPSSTKYWKKINSFHGGEIVIDKKFLKEKENNFTLGVFAMENSKYDLTFMPEFSNIIELKY